MLGKKLTPNDVADACREVLSAEDCDALARVCIRFTEAFVDACILLRNNGVDDPDTFLRERLVAAKEKDNSE